MISEVRPVAYQDYLSLPVLGPVLDEFTTWLFQQGYSLKTVEHKLAHSRQIDVFFRELGIQCLGDLAHSDFEAAWHRYRNRRPRIGGTAHLIERFLEGTLRLAPKLTPPRTPTDKELDNFAKHLKRERGLGNSTVYHYMRDLRNFLEYICYDDDTEVLATLTLKSIEEFLCACSKRFSHYSMQQVVAHLRAFLRFQHEMDVIESPLHTMIDRPRIYRLESLPRSLPWETIESLLSSIDRGNAKGIRDYTMLFLIAAYGLRPCEVVSLALDDIDWRAGSITIPQRKTGNNLILPITDSVGEVLVDYLKRGRPDLPFRELFLRIHAPHGPLKPGAVKDVFQLRARMSGLDIPYQGPYCIRHSYAVHLLRQGIPLKAIGDLLGHRSAESTCVYLRLATEDLRSVALPVPDEACIDDPPIIASQSPRPNTGGQKSPVKPPASQTGPLMSFLASDIEDYINLKRSLGRKYRKEADVLRSFNSFLATRYPQADDLTGDMFDRWSVTLHYLSPLVRYNCMRVVRNLCLYRKRSRPSSFVPDPQTFPANHQPEKPYIFSESDVSRILRATQSLAPCSRSPLRAQTFRIAIILLYTSGLRRGELLSLALGDFNLKDETLHIKATKFRKSRIIPLSRSAAEELKAFIDLRQKRHLPMEINSPLIWNGYGAAEGRSYSGSVIVCILHTLCASQGIFVKEDRPPRVHDLRHSFAVNVLKRWYEAGEDVNSKLPILSTYMGHVSVVYTHHYLSFVEGIRLQASARFELSFGSAVTAETSKPEQ